MKEKRLIYINLILVVILIGIISFSIKAVYFVPGKSAAKIIPAKSVKAILAPVKPIYEISSIKPDETKALKTKPKDLSEVYGNFPESDVGDNMVEAWKKVSPKDKAEFVEGLDKKIATAKAVLANNPNDKKAKNILAMTESLKKMIANNFNYDSKE